MKVRPAKTRTAPAWMPMEELQRLLALVDVLEPLPPRELRELASHASLDRLKARETPQPRFCWHCRKPLQARTTRCPFCNEPQ